MRRSTAFLQSLIRYSVEELIEVLRVHHLDDLRGIFVPVRVLSELALHERNVARARRRVRVRIGQNWRCRS